MRIQKNKMTCIGICLFLSCFFIQPADCFSANESDGANLLTNGGFEELAGDLPLGWQANGWLTDKDSTKYSVSSDSPHSGKFCAVIENVIANDSRFMQTISVKPDTVYKMSCWIKTENVGNVHTGANITVLLFNYLEHSPELRNTFHDWQHIEFYVQTKDDQNEIIVAARLGDFGEVNTGKAFFDDFRLEEMNKVPEGTYVSKLSQLGSQKQEQHSEREQTATLPAVGIPLSTILVLAFLFLVLACGVYFFFIQRDNLAKLNDTTLIWIFAGVLIVALIIRIIIALSFEGYHNDVESFKAWAIRSSTVAFNDFYVNNLFADYPPGYIYVLSVIGNFCKLLSIDFQSSLYVLILKLPSILADIGTSILIFTIVRKKLSLAWAFGLSVLYAINPGIIFTSAFWGQVDSIAALLVFLIINFIIEDKLWLSALILGFSVLIKIQTGFMAFILIFALIAKKDFKTWIACIAGGLLTFTITVIPFIPEHENIFWIFNLATRTITQYPYASVDAFNLMALFGGNWQPLDQHLFFMSYSAWGYIFSGLIMTFVTILYFAMRNEARNYLASFVFITFVFLLMPTMHERYLYPGLLLSLMSFAYTRKKGLFVLFTGYSLTYFINIAYVMNSFMRGQFIFQGDAVLMATAIVNLIMVAYPIKLLIDYAKEKCTNLRLLKSAPKLDTATDMVE